VTLQSWQLDQLFLSHWGFTLESALAPFLSWFDLDSDWQNSVFNQTESKILKCFNTPTSNIFIVINVDSADGSQPLDLRLHYYYDILALLTRTLLPTSDSWVLMISTLQSHMSIKGLCDFRTVSSYSLLA